MDSRLEKGPVCGVENCRSRWYEEGEDGYRYCQNGHQQFVKHLYADKMTQN
jgi:RNA polymerase I-specific transcription initiation factor RRN7